MRSNLRKMRLADLKREQAANDLSRSEAAMTPYIRAHHDRLKGDAAYLNDIKQLPLEKRYLWRVSSALKWGLADLDTQTAKMDVETLPADDLAAIRKELEFRLVQLRVLLDEIYANQEAPHA